MAFVELTDTSGASVLVNPICVAYLKERTGGGEMRTEIYISGRHEPLLVAGAPTDIANALEKAAPTPPDPTMSLLA
ncbi:hypothetical protein [Azospirillum picis]|uniref:Uncharacterized protein n=1 Tax=Azospirillum picis TaxID=488438 RepID=A0ABU0MGZ5_9PROT|nr:hypothetical protein [Azospirillum picis]MBP2299061.1 hypothetical protein [Azospirillum picis]MDQ0532697.1 hypothetical protein [Azospirillum picis]